MFRRSASAAIALALCIAAAGAAAQDSSKKDISKGDLARTAHQLRHFSLVHEAIFHRGTIPLLRRSRDARGMLLLSYSDSAASSLRCFCMSLMYWR